MLAALASPLYIILGILVVAGGVVTGVVLLAKWIFSVNEHDINTCDCPSCKQRRAQLIAQRVAEQEGQRVNPKRKPDPRNSKSGLTSTEDLQVGAVVEIGGDYYRVTSKLPSRLGGMVVALLNLGTKQMTFPPIRASQIQLPMWKVRPDNWRMPRRPE